MRATKHAPPDRFNLLERRHGLAEIVERRGGVEELGVLEGKPGAAEGASEV